MNDLAEDERALTYLGIPVAAAAPNVASVYRRRLRLGNQLFLAISQSGTSADLIEQAAAAYDSGAVTACITNDTGSELARKCEFILPRARAQRARYENFHCIAFGSRASYGAVGRG